MLTTRLFLHKQIDSKAARRAITFLFWRWANFNAEIFFTTQLHHSCAQDTKRVSSYICLKLDKPNLPLLYTPLSRKFDIYPLV